MAGIYGPITEHPEFPIDDDRRFTVVIKPHTYTPGDRFAWTGYDEHGYPVGVHQVALCVQCGNLPVHPVHPQG